LGAQALAFGGIEADDPARRLLARAWRIDRSSPLVREARQQLAEGERGRVAASGRME
jgi:hypothetical protein